MTATLEQTQAELHKLLGLVQQGEEVVITSQGRPVAKLTAVSETGLAPNRHAWLTRLAQLRQQLCTGKTGPTIEQLLAEDRSN
jgi:prevent-host-death family protein